MKRPILTSFTADELQTLSRLCDGLNAEGERLHNKIKVILNEHDGSTGNNPAVSVLVSDVEEEHPDNVIEIEHEAGGVSLRFPAYGLLTMADEFGPTVFVEYREGVPHVVVWADINQEDPTHVISLAGAAEDKRLSDEELQKRGFVPPTIHEYQPRKEE